MKQIIYVYILQIYLYHKFGSVHGSFAQFGQNIYTFAIVSYSWWHNGCGISLGVWTYNSNQEEI